MAAKNQSFPWLSHYGHYKFFEDRMSEHSRVLEVSREDVGLYSITRDEGDTLKVFICECYSYGIAEFIETSDAIDAVNAVVINSNWCGYTNEAKLHSRGQQVGLFDIGEFMAALNLPEYWTYLTEGQRDLFEQNGWI